MQASLGAADEGFQRADDREALGRLMTRLSRRERGVIQLRFRDVTQTEIAAALGMSEMTVSRILRAALDRLRAAHLEADPPSGAQPPRH